MTLWNNNKSIIHLRFEHGLLNPNTISQIKRVCKLIMNEGH
jgi:hypothetical protein